MKKKSIYCKPAIRMVNVCSEGIMADLVSWNDGHEEKNKEIYEEDGYKIPDEF